MLDSDQHKKKDKEFTRAGERKLRLANFIKDGRASVGIVDGESIFDLGGSSLTSARVPLKVKGFQTVEEILSEGMLEPLKNLESELASGQAIPLESVKLQSPILSPEKILCAAINYISHSKEQEVKPPSEPYFFTKFRNTIIGPGESILIPKISNKVDWEVELAVVIGKKGKYIERKDAMDYVAGYTIANDVSFRDLQFPKGWPEKLDPLGLNWVRGKGLDTAFPMGPWLVTKDELPDVYESKISLSINGVMRQNSSVGEMVFKVDSMIEYLSQGITLSPGDVISTGTPLGVAEFTGAPYLKEGDIVESMIEGIGVLSNTLRTDSSSS